MTSQEELSMAMDDFKKNLRETWFYRNLELSLWWFFDYNRYRAYKCYRKWYFFSRLKSYRLAKKDCNSNFAH